MDDLKERLDAVLDRTINAQVIVERIIELRRENKALRKALERITTEVGYMIEAPTKDLIVSGETKGAHAQANDALGDGQ